MTSQGNRDSQKRDAEEWEAVFADSDPTRVLPPYARESEPAPGEEPVSAVRYRQDPAPVTPAAGLPSAGQVAPAPPYAPEAQVENAAPRPPQQAAGRISPYHRIQFIPAFLGALIAHGTISALFQVATPLLGLFGAQSYGSPTLAAVALFGAETRAAALPWSIFLALSYLLAFAAAGYAAARMSGVAPVKQALGVLLVTLLGILSGSLLTWATSGMDTALSPQFSGHTFFEADFATGALTLLAVLTLALLSALLGAFVGGSYHRKLAKTQGAEL